MIWIPDFNYNLQQRKHLCVDAMLAKMRCIFRYVLIDVRVV